MMSGSPPTELKARTGLLTPPTRSFVARAKISRERRRSRGRVGRVAFIAKSKKDEEKNLTQRAQRKADVPKRNGSVLRKSIRELIEERVAEMMLRGPHNGTAISRPNQNGKS